MSLTFALKGNKEKQVYATYSHTALELRGHFHFRGPQIVGGEGGAPTWVYNLFKTHPDITAVAITGENSGVIYSPIKD